MHKNLIYSLIPVGAALVAGGIQTAIIGYSFDASQWYIAGLLIVCVWLTSSMDAVAFHHSAMYGATTIQKIFLGVSALSLVLVLGVDLVWMFAPEAFSTTDAIIRDLSYATGVNLAVSIFCLLGWIFFSQEHANERVAHSTEQDVILQRRLDALRSPEAEQLYAQIAHAEIISAAQQRNKQLQYILNTMPQSPKPIALPASSQSAASPQTTSPNPSPEWLAYLARVEADNAELQRRLAQAGIAPEVPANGSAHPNQPPPNF